MGDEAMINAINVILHMSALGFLDNKPHQVQEIRITVG